MSVPTFPENANGHLVYNKRAESRVIQISAAEAANHFRRLTDHVRVGDEVVIEHDARPTAVVRPVAPATVGWPSGARNYSPFLTFMWSSRYRTNWHRSPTRISASEVGHWMLMSLQQGLVKTGSRLLKQACYY